MEEIELLPQQDLKDTLRFMACGSVDDGKSTLIGRLLYDSGLVFDDELSALLADSRRYGTTGKEPDFALLLDGLLDERQQGITIDVAYRFFSTEKRSFVVIDTPGHEQYTRNMATGASKADLAVILVDSRKGLLPQTKRHATICSLLGLQYIVLAINKMDLVGHRRDAYCCIVKQFESWASQFKFASVTAIPVSALNGDNITTPSINMPWYHGPTILGHLETVRLEKQSAAQPFRFPVQWVNRAAADFRGYAGTVASGSIAVGDIVAVAVSGRESRVKELLTQDGIEQIAQDGDAITITLVDEIDVARGDILVTPAQPPAVSDRFSANLIWMSEQDAIPGRSYLGRIGTSVTPIKIAKIKHKLELATLDRIPADSLCLNDIALCELTTDVAVAFDRYEENRRTGSLIIIDRFTNNTVGAGMIEGALQKRAELQWQPTLIGWSERAAQKNQRPAIVWFTGLPASGKSTIANILERKLHANGYHTMLLDGDNLRRGLNRDLGFSREDRVENIRRAGEIAKLMVEAGLITLCSFISPYHTERASVRGLVREGEFIEVFVDTPVEECVRRDPKGLYAKARAGLIKSFTGLDGEYEPPTQPEIHLRTLTQTPDQLADIVVANLASLGILR